MNKQLFRTVLLWALFALHILCSAPVVGQTTTSVTPVVTFPSELPIGTNYLEKLTALRIKSGRVLVRGDLFIETSGTQEYVILSARGAQGGVLLDQPAYTSNEQLLLHAAPVGNEFLSDGVRAMNGREDYYGAGFVRIQMYIEDISKTRLFSAVWLRYILRDEDGVFKTQDLLPDEAEVVPAFLNDPSGRFEYLFPDGMTDLAMRGILLDAVGPNGHDTGSTFTGALPRTTSRGFSLPWEYIDGSYTGKLYIQIAYSPDHDVRPEQVFAVDLQTGRIERPQIRVTGVRLAGPYTFNGKPIWVLRPSCLTPRGTSFGTYFSEKPDGPWTFFKTVTVGAGGDVPLVEFETGLNFAGPAGFVKVIVDDNAYPEWILKALPKP